MASRKSNKPSPMTVIDGGLSVRESGRKTDIVDDVIRLGEVSVGDLKLVKGSRDRYAVQLLNILMGGNNIEDAREFAARLMREEGLASPEFLSLAAELLSPRTTNKTRGRRGARVRKFELEICAKYWVLSLVLPPAEARRRVIEELSSDLSARTVNQFVTEYTRKVHKMAAQLGVDERQIVPMGYQVALIEFFRNVLANNVHLISSK
jgi:hypothetical protein